MSKNGSSSKAAPAGKRTGGMTTRTAISVIVACVAVAGLIFALTTTGGGSAKVDTTVPASVSALGTGHPTLYEFSTDS